MSRKGKMTRRISVIAAMLMILFVMTGCGTESVKNEKVTAEQVVSAIDSIGYVGDASYFPDSLRLRDIRGILRDFYPSFRPDQFDEYARRWKLPPRDALKRYSRGMKVKLMFAAVLLTKKTSPFLLVSEPPFMVKDASPTDASPDIDW